MIENTIIMNIDGKDVVFDILYMFESYKTKKKYIVYTDNVKDINGNLNIYSSIYENNNIIKINDNTDWIEVENFLKTHMVGEKND